MFKNLPPRKLLESVLLAGVFSAFLGVYLSVSLISFGVALALFSGLIFFIQNPSSLKTQPLFYPVLFLSVSICLSILLAEPYAFGKPLEKVGYLFAIFPFTLCFSLRPQAKIALRNLAVTLTFVLSAVALGQSLGFFSSAPSFLNKHVKLLPNSETLSLATGFTFHHTPFGASMTWLFHLSLAQWLFSSGKSKRWIYLLAAGSALLGAFVSFSRGVWLSLAISGLSILALISWKKTLAALALGVGLLTAIFFRFPELESRLQTIRLDANPERIELWKISWEMFKDRPFLGQGYHSFGERLQNFRAPETLYPGFPKEAHNMYLDFLSSTGVFGFIAFLFFLGSISSFLWGTWKSSLEKDQRAWILTCMGGFLAFLLAGFFDRHFYMTQTLTCLLIFLSVGQSIPFKLPKTPLG